MGRLPAQQRREQLLDTAARLFATHGYAGATTSQIAKASGVTEPIIYRHFASKRDLFIALIERTGAQTISLWEHELRTATDPAERLRRLLHANPMVSTRGKELYRVIIQAMTEVEDPKILESLTHHIEMLHRFLAGEVRRAQEAESVSKRFGPEMTAWALIHLGLGYGVLSAMGIGKTPDNKSGMRIADFLGELMLGNRYRKEDQPPPPAGPSQPA